MNWILTKGNFAPDIPMDKSRGFTALFGNVRPLYFHTWEATRLSEMLAVEGRPAVFAAIGQNVFEGNWQLRQGNKMTKLFLQAMEPLRKYGVHFTTYLPESTLLQ